MSAPEVVYRSTHPDVLAHWDTVKAAQQAWPDRMKAALKDWGVSETKWVHLTHSGVPIGLDYPADLTVPNGWRRDRTGSLVPARTTATGKGIARELAALVRAELGENLPGGMPPASFGERFLLRPVLERVGDQVFACWSGEPFAVDLHHVDPQIWERIKLSEYHLAIEAVAE